MDMNDLNVLNDLSELEALINFDNEMKEMENTVLTQNLEGFASCFPDWDLHPPVRR